jgi:hypothetical protein
VQPKQASNNEKTPLEMTIALVAIFVMILETLIGTMGLPLFFK